MQTHEGFNNADNQTNPKRWATEYLIHTDFSPYRLELLRIASRDLHQANRREVSSGF
jgi:hypothetical protein